MATDDMRDWFEFRPTRDDFAPSALDCSRWIEAPAGRHGFLKVQGERFVFEDGTPARFYGSQIGWITDRDEVAYVARRLRKQGINIVRRHGDIGIDDRQGKSVLDYSAEGWDGLDYMIARFGEEGVYFILDVDYYLPVRPGEIEGLPEGGRTMHLMFFHDEAKRLRFQRMTDVFTHVNAYTGLRYCDDPLVALVEVVNEDSLFWYSLDGLKEPFKGQLERLFAEWLRERRRGWGEERAPLLQTWKFSEKHLREHPDEVPYAQDQMTFLYELELKYFGEAYEHLRGIGLKTPISGTNWRGGGFTTRIHLRGQAELDYLDRHGYWDHPLASGEPNTTWRIATCRFHDLPMVKAIVVGPDQLQENNVGNLVLAKAWERILGMPMTITEWNTCLPNEYSLEGGGLMTAYGLLQGWEGPMQFGYFSTHWREALGPGSFDMLANPPQLLQFPALAAMWYRQDIEEAPLVAEMAVTTEELFEPRDSFMPLPWPAAWVGQGGLQLRRRAARWRDGRHRPLLGRGGPDRPLHHGRAMLERPRRPGHHRRPAHAGRHRLPQHRAGRAGRRAHGPLDALRRRLRHQPRRRRPGRAQPAPAGDGRRPGPQHRNGVPGDGPDGEGARRAVAAPERPGPRAHPPAGRHRVPPHPHRARRPPAGMGPRPERPAREGGGAGAGRRRRRAAAALLRA